MRVLSNLAVKKLCFCSLLFPSAGRKWNIAGTNVRSEPLSFVKSAGGAPGTRALVPGALIIKGIKEQVNTIANRYNKWLYLFLNILFATCYRNNVYISFHFHMGMDHFFRVSYLLQRLLPLSYLVQNQLFE